MGLIASLAVGIGAVLARSRPMQPLPYTGVNLAGGEFYEPSRTHKPVYGKDFIYPSVSEIDYFIQHGVNIVRLPFRWETVQPTLLSPLDKRELERLRGVVASATLRGLTVILDPHNYARYYQQVIGSADVPQEALADFWRRLAVVFSNDPKVWFGLMNEPHDMPTETWVQAANQTIAAIREAGAHNVILVPGNGWSGAGGWSENWYGTPNSVAMLDIRDPSDNFLIEVHLYFDGDAAGKTPDVVSPDIGVERIKGFTAWAREHRRRAFLGEFAVPATEEGKVAVTRLLSAMEKSRDVWVGFTWWAAGPWWKDYMFSIEPAGGKDKPQMAYLEPFLQKRPVAVDQYP